MAITKKFILIISFGLLPLLLTFFSVFSVFIFLIYNIICFGLLTMDYFLSPKAKIWEIERETEEKLFFKTENKMIFKVKNNFTKELQIELKDEIPDWHFNVTNTNLSKKIKSDMVEYLDYSFIPTKRGSYRFKNIYIKYHGVLGLCTIYAKIHLEKEFKVYPNLSDLSKYRLLMQNNKLLRMGEKTITLQGIGTEFENLREYVDGDDYRKINWMTSARENKLIINQYEMEKNQPVFILLDTGRPMSYSVNGYKKLDYAIDASLVLSDIVNQKGDNSGLFVFDTDIKTVIPPSKGENHRNNFMESLYHVEDTKNTSNYGNAFKELVKKQKRRSLVFIFTDFETLEEAKDLVANIGIVTRHHIPIILLMKNESLIKTANSVDDQNIKNAFEKAMAKNSLAEREKIKKILNIKGISCIETSSENFSLCVVNQYLSIKNRKAI